MSRNKREGRYHGKMDGVHMRVPRVLRSMKTRVHSFSFGDLFKKLRRPHKKGAV